LGRTSEGRFEALQLDILTKTRHSKSAAFIEASGASIGFRADIRQRQLQLRLFDQGATDALTPPLGMHDDLMNDT
jgi:hypothetical protein